MKNVTYIISNIDKAVAFEWIAEKLSQEKFRLSFVLLNPGTSHLHDFLHARGIPVRSVRYRGKKDIPRAIASTVSFLRKQKTEIVHCHLFDAGIVGLTAASLAGIRKRIYTRHHSSYHHVYHKQAVKYDKYINRKATHIVAVSRTVFDILVKDEHVPASKISVIHHGFELQSFSNPPSEDVIDLRHKYSLAEHSPIIGVISRFTEWKGIQYVIPAFKTLLSEYPKAQLLLFNADGPYAPEIIGLLKKLPPASYKLVKFERNLFAMYHLFDVFVHVPVDEHSEAFGQTYIEALAAGIPSVFTLSGIANEIIRNGIQAVVVPYRNSEAIYIGIKHLVQDKNQAKKMAAAGQTLVQESFSIDKMISNLEVLYNS